MFVGAGMPSIAGPTPRKNVRKNPGQEGKVRKAISRGAPATMTAPEIIVMTLAHIALLTDVFIETLPRLCTTPTRRQGLRSSYDPRLLDRVHKRVSRA
jgi:hypothetical protein